MTAPSICVGCKWARWSLKHNPHHGTCRHPQVDAAIAALGPSEKRPEVLVVGTLISAYMVDGFTHCPTREPQAEGGA